MTCIADTGLRFIRKNLHDASIAITGIYPHAEDERQYDKQSGARQQDARRALETCGRKMPCMSSI